MDLFAKVHLTLGESLLGFSRTVLIHLDGRQIRITKRPGQVTRPGSIDRIVGEGMPRERDLGERGDLYIQWEVDFPEDDWMRGKPATDQQHLRQILPQARSDLPAEDDTEVIEPLTRSARIQDWGKNQPERRQQEDFWEDETDGPQAGCAST